MSGGRDGGLGEGEGPWVDGDSEASAKLANRRSFCRCPGRWSTEELLERATRPVFESGRLIAHVVRDLGLPPETLRIYVRRAEANGAPQDLLSNSEREEIKADAPRGFAQLRRPNGILRAVSYGSPRM